MVFHLTSNFPSCIIAIKHVKHFTTQRLGGDSHASRNSIPTNPPGNPFPRTAGVSPALRSPIMQNKPNPRTGTACRAPTAQNEPNLPRSSPGRSKTQMPQTNPIYTAMGLWETKNSKRTQFPPTPTLPHTKNAKRTQSQHRRRLARFPMPKNAKRTQFHVPLASRRHSDPPLRGTNPNYNNQVFTIHEMLNTKPRHPPARSPHRHTFPETRSRNSPNGEPKPPPLIVNVTDLFLRAGAFSLLPINASRLGILCAAVHWRRRCW